MAITAEAQLPPGVEEVVNRLGPKYDWGSMYLTFSAASHLYSLVTNENRLSPLPENERRATALLRTLLQEYHNRPLNRAIGVIVLDLRNWQAGYKLADDPQGGITSLNWAHDDVKSVSILCDKFLTGLMLAENASKTITTKNVRLAEAWHAYSEISDNPYIPDSRRASVEVDLNKVLTTRRSDFKALESSDRSLFAAIHKFADEFDTSTKTTGATIARVDRENGLLTVTEAGSSKTIPYSEHSTTFVNRHGSAVSAADVSAGAPVGIEYARTGTANAATKVVVGKAGDSPTHLEGSLSRTGESSSTTTVGASGRR